MGGVLALIEKGLMVVSLAIQAGQSAEPALQVLKNLVTGAQQGEVTEAQLAEAEALLDKLITQFNEPLPEQ